MHWHPCRTRFLAHAPHLRRNFPEPCPTNRLNPMACGLSRVSVISRTTPTSLSSSAIIPIFKDDLPSPLHASTPPSCPPDRDTPGGQPAPWPSSSLGCDGQQFLLSYRM